MKRVESEFNKSTTAMEKNRAKADVLSKSIENQKKYVSELEKGLAAAKERYGENATQTQKWQQAVNNAKTELNKMTNELSSLEDEFEELTKTEGSATEKTKEFGEKLKDTGEKISGVGEKITSLGEGLTKYVSAPLSAAAAATVAAWKDVDSGLDTVTIKTGATGEALDGLHASALKLTETIPTSFETAGEAVGEVNTRFGVTGEELETLSGKFIKFAELNDTDVSTSVDSVQKIMAAFGLETKDAGALLDAMNKTGQNTGISMDKLQTSMVKNAASLKDMGLNAYDSAAFLGSLEVSGANAETVMSGLQKAMVNANKQGKTLPEALKEFQGVMNSTASDQEKLNAAIDLFGSKAGPAIYNACKSGSLSFESLSANASTYLGNVETTFDNILDPADKFRIALNKAKAAGSVLGGALLDVAAPAVEGLGDAAKSAGEWLSGLPAKARKNLAVGAIVGMGIGPAVTVIGKLATTIGDTVTAIGEFTIHHPELAKVLSVVGPAGIAIAAIAGVTAAMIIAEGDSLEASETLQTMLDSTAERVGALDTATASLKETITASQENIASIEGKASMAQSLVDTLEQLSQKSSLTTAEQEKMQGAVNALNQLYPELGVQIDSTTGKLNMGIEEIRSYIDASKDMMLLKAYNEAYAESFSELVKLQTELDKSSADLAIQEQNLATLQAEATAANENASVAVSALGDDTEDLTALLNANIAATEAGAGATAGQVSGLADLQAQQILTSNEVREGTEATDELAAAMAEAQEEYDAAQEYNEGLAAKVEELKAKLGLTDEQAQELTDTMSDEADATEEAAQATEENTAASEENADATKEQSTALRDFITAVGNATTSVLSNTIAAGKAWDDLYQSTADSIHSQLGLFDEWQQNSELTAEQMVANMESQVEGMRNYADNMAYLTELAAESSDPNLKQLVQDFADAGISMAGEVDVMVKDIKSGGENFNKYLSGYGERTGIEKRLAKTSTYIKSGFLDKNEKMFATFTKSIQKNFGDSKLFSGFTTNSAKSVSEVVGNFLKGMPKVSSEISTQLSKGSKEGATQVNSNVTTGMSSMFSVVGSFAQKASANISLNLSNGSKSGANAVILNSSNAASSMESKYKTASSNAKKAIEEDAQNGSSTMESKYKTASSNTKKAIEKDAKDGAKSAKDTYSGESKTAATNYETNMKAGFKNTKDGEGGLVKTTDSGMAYLSKSVSTTSEGAIKILNEKVGGLKLNPEVAKVTVETAKNNAVNALKKAFTNIPATMAELSNAKTRGAAAKKIVEGTIKNLTGFLGDIKNVSTKANNMKIGLERPISALKGTLASIGNVATAASHAVSSGNSKLRFTGHLSQITGAASAAMSAKANAQAWLNGHPATLPVYSKTMNTIHPYANGGFITQEQIATVGEHNDPEVIIPLSTSKRARALSLFEQAGEILGVKAPDVKVKEQKVPNVRVPQPEPGPVIDYDALYSVVATAARQGLQSANIKVYWNGREAGRIMRDMGVQFA